MRSILSFVERASVKVLNVDGGSLLSGTRVKLPV